MENKIHRFVILFEMTRKYFCDHCDKRIPSDLFHRKAHHQTVQHQQKKKDFYLQYRGENNENKFIHFSFLKKS